MASFPKNHIMSLISDSPRYNLGESIGPDLLLADLLNGSGPPDNCEFALANGTPQGDPRLRHAIADICGVSAEEIVVTVGGVHALVLIALASCNPGDEAVTASPLFPLARNALEIARAEVSCVSCLFDQGYRLTSADIRSLLSKKTRLVYLASPQKLSGVNISTKAISEILAMLEQICPEAFLLLDETCHDAAYGESPVSSSVVGPSPKLISCASLSKCYGAPGLRLGWIIARDPAFREQLVASKFNTVISCSAIDELLALKVFEQRDRIFAERRQRLTVGLAMTAAWVLENEDLVDWVRPDAGPSCCVRLKPSVFDDAAVGRFYEELAIESVRVANGAWFGDEPHVFRLGFGLLHASKLEAALAALSVALRRAICPKSHEPDIPLHPMSCGCRRPRPDNRELRALASSGGQPRNSDTRR
jgi:aspartate/methionine/tyrosine aminotransferase